MSGGHFNYTQYQLTQIADDIEQLIVDNDNEEKNEWGMLQDVTIQQKLLRHFKPQSRC